MLVLPRMYFNSHYLAKLNKFKQNSFINFRLNQYIYVVGGFDGNRQLASVERYDTENQVWDTVSPIRISCSALSLTVLDGKLYAMGGFDGTSFLSTVEVYDPILNEWHEGTPLTSGRSGHASAVIYQPSCVASYMECIDATLNSDKRAQPPADDDSAKRTHRPTATRNVQSTAPNGLHAFSGSRCTQCDEDTSAAIHCTGPTSLPSNYCDSKFNANDLDPVNCPLRMDCEDIQNALNAQNANTIGDESMNIDEPYGDASSNYSDDNRKKDRRKESFQSEGCGLSFDESSMDQPCSSNSLIPFAELQREEKRCALSNFVKNKFIAWSTNKSTAAASSSTAAASSSTASSSNCSSGESILRRCSRKDDENGNKEVPK